MDGTHRQPNDIVLTHCECVIICRLLHQGDPTRQLSVDAPIESCVRVVERNVSRGNYDGDVGRAVRRQRWRIRTRTRTRVRMVPPKWIGIKVEHEQVEGLFGIVFGSREQAGEFKGCVQPRGERDESVSVHRATPLLKFWRDEPTARVGSPVVPIDVHLLLILILISTPIPSFPRVVLQSLLLPK